MARLRYPDPNRPLIPAWPALSQDDKGEGSLWTRTLRGRDRGPLHQGALIMPGASVLKAVAYELAMTVKAAVVWTAVWTAVGLGTLYGLLGLASLAH